MLPHLLKAVELVPEVKVHLSEKAVEFLKSIEQYDRQLWEYTLALFRGGDSGAFIDKFTAATSNQLTRAFNEGARSVGVEPEDMTEEDLAYLKEIIDSEYEHILDLGTAIEASRELELSAFRQAFRSRIDLWVARYTDVINRAKTYFGGMTRLEWKLGETEQHCDTCAALNGIVAWAKEWEQAGVHPQSPPNEILQCGGWKCDCSLNVTDKRRSPGALGRIMDIAVAANIGKSYNPNQPRVPAGDSEGGQWTSGIEGNNKDPKTISKDVDIDKTGKPINNQTVYRYGDTSGDTLFYSRDKNYSEEYAIVRGGSPKDVKEEIISINNPLVVNPSSINFSDPEYENPIITAAKEYGYDGVVFNDKDNDLEFYVVFK